MYVHMFSWVLYTNTHHVIQNILFITVIYLICILYYFRLYNLPFRLRNQWKGGKKISITKGRMNQKIGTLLYTIIIIKYYQIYSPYFLLSYYFVFTFIPRISNLHNNFFKIPLQVLGQRNAPSAGRYPSLQFLQHLPDIFYSLFQ